MPEVMLKDFTCIQRTVSYSLPLKNQRKSLVSV